MKEQRRGEVTLRELKAMLKRTPKVLAPRLLAEYLLDRAQERLNETLPSPADDHGHAQTREEPKQ